MESPLWLWTKTSSVRWEDSWEERLRFLPPGACVMLSSPGSRALRIRAYTDASTAKKLAGYFGGSIRKLPAREWNKELARELTPVNARGRLVVFSEKTALAAHKAKGNRPPGMLIPASMAFGTGSHPTTAGCLRFLADVAGELTAGEWSSADLGTGSGILAIAAKRLGAGKVFAYDYDPVCVRTAKTNARLNREKLEEIQELDVHDWKPKQSFEVVTANLFSNTLISAAPVIAGAVKPGGVLIFSGVLRDQLEAVREALEKSGLRLDRHNPRGRWVFGLCRK